MTSMKLTGVGHGTLRSVFVKYRSAVEVRGSSEWMNLGIWLNKQLLLRLQFIQSKYNGWVPRGGSII